MIGGARKGKVAFCSEEGKDDDTRCRQPHASSSIDRATPRPIILGRRLLHPSSSSVPIFEDLQRLDRAVDPSTRP